MFCKSLFVLLYFFLWPLCCLFFFDILILIIPLVSSNSSSYIWFRSPLSSLCHSNSEAQSYISYIVAVSYVTILWQIQTFPHSRLIIGFVTRLTRRVPIMEQELSTLLEHPSSPSHIVGLCCSIFMLCFVYHCLSFRRLSFSHCILCSFSIYGFWLPLSYLHILHTYDPPLSTIFQLYRGDNLYLLRKSVYTGKTKDFQQFADKFTGD